MDQPKVSRMLRLIYAFLRTGSPQGVLPVVAYYVKSEDMLLSTFELLERNLRIIN